MVIVRVNWSLPLEKKVLQEIGQTMVFLLPYVKNILIADSEGAILELDLPEVFVEDLEELRKTLKYVRIEEETDQTE